MHKLITTIYIALSFQAMASAQTDPGTTLCEDTCRHIHGIDVSHYQGDVFWEHVGSNSGLQYVYIKATEGADNVDDRYDGNITDAHKHGLKVGSYHFFRVKSGLQAQLDNFKSQCRPGDQDLIPMVDVETTSGLSSAEFCDSLLLFLQMMEQAYKQKPLLYTYTNFYNKHMKGRFDDYPLMIAQYTDEEPVLADERDIMMWQYTAKGRIQGVNTLVDKSRFMGRHSMREIRFRHR